MALSPGEHLGNYEIISLIGKGGMGEVYKAHDSRLRRDVAIKVSRDHFTERFDREARVVASLNHANICTVFDVGPNYLVLELIEGDTLADRIAQGPIPLDEALPIAGQIAEALREAHEKGVTHRDLKPGNVKIRPDGAVKVLDFGLAKVGGMPGMTSDDSPTLTLAATQVGAILGTASYMSPEQAKGKPVDRRSDIYAFGVVLYEMLTGQRLNQGESLSETLAITIKEDADLSRVPFEVRRLLTSCLKKDPQQRLRHIDDWKLLLEDAPAATSSAPVKTRSSLLWPAVAAAALLAALGLGFVHLRETPPAMQEVRLQMPKPDDLTFNPGTQAAISPDGKWLAFPAQGPDGASRYYLRAIDSLDVRPLPGSEGIIGLAPPPFWSYDSRFVVYGAGGKLKKNEISGTPAQVIADIGVQFVQGGSWSQDGVILYARSTGNLMQVSANGGTPQPVTKLSVGETAHRWAQFLPDGHRFLYLRYSGSAETAGIYVGSIDVKPEEQSRQMLLPADRQVVWVQSPQDGKTYLLMQRGEALLAQPFDPKTATLSGTAEPIAAGVGAYPAATAGMWTAARNGDLTYRAGGAGLPRLVWRTLAGVEAGVVGEPANYGSPELSPDGKRLAYSLIDAQGNRDIWVKDLLRGNTTRLTFDPRLDSNPVWSPEGTKILFSANRGGAADLYEKNADGSGEERLVWKSDEDKFASSWSRDGKLVAFTSNGSQTSQDLWLLRIATNGTPDAKAQVFLKTEFEEARPVISPDGRWIAYSSLQSGNYEIYVRPVQAGSNQASSAQWMVSGGGGVVPHWSPDGKRLYYLGLNGALMAVDVTAGATFQYGAPQQLLGLNAAQPWAVDPAGGRFLFQQVGGAIGPPSPFTLVLNWMGRMKQ